MKIHFVGIGGSGLSGIAMIAKAYGYEISGCDLNVDTYYIDELKKDNVRIFEGQNEDHLDGVDLVVTTPAVFFKEKLDSEIKLAKEKNILLTAREFESKYLQKDRQVICIAGTHGKSTTTALAGLLFGEAKLDPTVTIGANVKEWNGNFRVGKGKNYISEADEFFDSFLDYSPEVIILNNIEFDHPDFFGTPEKYLESFKKFILKLTGRKILIYNADDNGINKLLKLISKKDLENINLIGYSIKNKKLKLSEEKSEFEVNGEKYLLQIPGEYNISNALGVIALAKVFNINTKIVKKVLRNFTGIGRRLELIGDKNGTKVYDDYAHHPTAIKKTLKALRQKYPNKKIIVIDEPHTFSRTKALLPLYKNAFEMVDEVIIAPIYKSRDNDDFGITGEDIVKISGHQNIKYFDSLDKIINYISAHKFDVIVVMGAGESYKLAKDIFNRL